MANIINGFDVSSSTDIISISELPADFIFIKCTLGASVVDNNSFVEEAKELNKRMVLYHVANGKTNGAKEADNFINAVSSYAGNAVLVLKFIGSAVEKKGVVYAKEFADTVYNTLGIKVVTMMTENCLQSLDWSDYVAEYNNLILVSDNLEDNIAAYKNLRMPSMDLKGFTLFAIEYTETGKFAGYDDVAFPLYKSFTNTKSWSALSAIDKSAIKERKVYTVDQIANYIINGNDEWKLSGASLKNKIISIGLDYDSVMNKISELKGFDKAKEEKKESIKKVVDDSTNSFVTEPSNNGVITADPVDVKKAPVNKDGKTPIEVIRERSYNEDEIATMIADKKDEWNTTPNAIKSKIEALGASYTNIMNKVTKLLEKRNKKKTEQADAIMAAKLSNNTTSNDNSSNIKVAHYYTIKKGENMSKVAKMHNMTLSELMAMNPAIKNPMLVKPGQKVKIS